MTRTSIYVAVTAGTMILATSTLTLYTAIENSKSIAQIEPSSATIMVESPKQVQTRVVEINKDSEKSEKMIEEIRLLREQVAQYQNMIPLTSQTTCQESFIALSSIEQNEKESTPSQWDGVPEKYSAEVEEVLERHAKNAMANTEALLESGEYTSEDLALIKENTNINIQQDMESVLPDEYYDEFFGEKL